MPHLSLSLRRLFWGLVLSGSLPCLAQTISVGFFAEYAGNLNPTGVETVIQTLSPANIDGGVTRATFGWSNSPCSAAVKIKFFRLIRGNPVSAFSFLAERGPFDVTAPLDTRGNVPPATQTVALDPPVQLQAGDVIAITNLTSCGGPTLGAYVPRQGLFPPLPPLALSFSGDVTTAVLQSAGKVENNVSVSAVGATSSLVLLQGRFQASLLATDPRSGRQTAGFPVALRGSLNNSAGDAGYFSLPDFTGDATFPEIMIKMVDATATPSLGGDFWFFHAPLTDVSYTITVTELKTRAVRTYTNASAGPGQLCGGSDTSAFIP